jgi:general secretion pathway protein C
MAIASRRSFGIANVIVVGICAGLAGRAVGHLVEAAYLIGDAAGTAATVRHRPPPREPPPRAKDGEAIVQRNIFCSGCARARPGTRPKEPEATEPQKSSLPLELLSTMVVRADDRFSMAIIRDLSTQQKDTGLFNKGALIGATGAEVVEVRPRQVYIRNGGSLEYLELTDAAASAQPPPAPAPGAAPPAHPRPSDVEQGVRCAGKSCTIDRALVDKLLANTNMLATAARFAPMLKDGKPSGFKLLAIRPNGIFDKLQFQNDDVVRAINGSDMGSIDAALGLYTKLRNASHLSVQLERHGETTTLDYTIR